ncbi:MAG TPA: GlsB/YeaQ/YmgE family stress response membrane protein [Roseiflexaceae bacterium]|nr:GlsB/YeaQ/YmgE family stress response membrane protein [Roseiflexaceae bacterium]
MINIVLWLVIGGALGWLASIVMQIDVQQGEQIDAQQALLLNMGVGLAGAFLGGVLFSLLGNDRLPLGARTFSLGALVVAFSGAVLLLAIVTMVRRGAVRSS